MLWESNVTIEQKISELATASAQQVQASSALTSEVQNKMAAIDNKTEEAKQICSDAAGNLLNEAKTVSSWFVPETIITLYPAKRIGVEDPTIDYGTYETADNFNPTKHGKDNLLRVADFDSPNWVGGKASWVNENRYEASSWNHQQLTDDQDRPCFSHLIDLHDVPRLISRHNKENIVALRTGKIPYLIMRVTVEGQVHGVNRTFLEILKNINGSSSNVIKSMGDGTYDTLTPNSAVYGGGFVEKGYPIPVESAGYGNERGFYNGTVAIPLEHLYSGNQSFLFVNVGHKTLHIHSYGIAYFNPQGLEVS